MSDTLSKSKPLALTQDPWHQLEQDVPYCLLGQPMWVDGVGGDLMLLAVRRKDRKSEVHTFLIKAKSLPMRLPVDQPFVVRNGKIASSL